MPTESVETHASGSASPPDDAPVNGVGALAKTGGGSPAGEPLIEPMTGSVLARLFGVPLLIISVIVGCAVVVVLLFGSITTDRERSITELLDILESNVGEKTAGVLLPDQKEVWQVSRELALRLQNKDAELASDEVDETAVRLAALLARHRRFEGERSEMTLKQMNFVMHALARTGSEKAVSPLMDMLDDPSTDARREALSALAEMRETPYVGAAVPRVLQALKDEESIVRTVACASITAIGDSSNPAIVSGLQDAYFDADREVRWNATLALARMGSDKGKSLLLDMLTRSYWEDEVRVRIETTPGSFSEYPLPAQAADRYLTAAVESAAHLDDAEVWAQIQVLAKDGAPSVKGAAKTALESRNEAAPAT